MKIMMKRIICFIFILFFLISGFSLKAFEKVNASSYILMEATSERIIDGKNINERYLTASICKILTAIVVIENCDINEYVLIDYECPRQIGSSIYLKENDLLKVEDLLYGLLLRSGNDCAYMLAVHVGSTIEGFVKMMNNYAKKIGMKSSTFSNPSGLDNESTNYSTAYDMAILMIEAMKNDTFRKIVGTKKYFTTTGDGVNLYLYNKHKLVQKYDYIIGGKTGYTEKANRTLVTYSSLNGMELVCVTFNCSDDWNAHLNLIKETYQNYFMTKVMDKQVIKAKSDYSVTPYIPVDVYIPLKRDEEISIKVFLLNDPKDEIIGVIKFYVNDELIISKKVYRYY